MSQIIENATFETVNLKNPRGGNFETVEAPLLLVHKCSAPFGVELESIYSPLPVFAGGTDPRKYLAVQLELTEEAAEGFRRLDDACLARSKHTGAWSPLVTLRDGRQFIKARINIEGARLSTFSLDGSRLLTGWEHFQSALTVCNNLKGAELKAAVTVQYVWSVSGKRGLTLGIEQLAIKRAEPRELVDHFA